MNSLRSFSTNRAIAFKHISLFRQRSPYLLVLAVSLLVSGLFGVSAVILIASFTKVEKQATEQALARALSSLDDELKNLETTAIDYGFWGDTNEFMAQPNAEYISENYTPEHLKGIDVDAIALYDRSQHLVFGKRYDPTTHQSIPLAQGWHLKTCRAVQPSASVRAHCVGLQLTPSGLLMTAIVPITSEAKDAPILGTLLMGRRLDAARIEHLSRVTHLGIDIHPLGTEQPEKVADLELIQQRLELGAPAVIKPNSWQTLSGYALLHDLHHQPVALVQVSLPRTIYRQGIMSLLYLALSLAAIGILLGGVMWVLFQKLRQYIQERDRIQQELLQEKELASITLHAIGDGVITIDAVGNVLSMNPVAEHMTGWHITEAQGLSLSKILNIVDEETHEPVKTPIEQSLHDGQRLVVLNSRSVLISKHGDEFAIDTSVAPIRAQTNDIVGAVLVFRDVSQMRLLTRQLTRRANYDALTGLLNRSEFEAKLEQAIAATQIHGQEHALCFLDLDRFKIVNDTCGHAAGDELLRQISALLLQKVRKTDVVARLGGDEFAILLYQCPPGQATYLAQVICAAVADYRFLWGDCSFTVGMSIGLVSIGQKSTTLEDVLHQSDLACYMAKQQGRGQVYINPSSSAQPAEPTGNIDWVQQVKRALETERFHLVYQHIQSLNPNLSSSPLCEVLLRMADKDGKLLPPGSFLPIAERYKLTADLDRWVIRQLLAELSMQRSLLTQMGWQCQFAVNLSAASINDDAFVEFLREQLEIFGVPPQCLCMEISETVAIANLSQTTRVVQTLKGLGCLIALDDFGSSIGAFDYLRTLPIDFLKIDGDVIKNVLKDSVAHEIIGSITRVGHALGLRVIAECVSNQTIFQKIQVLGSDYAQGYYISKPGRLGGILQEWVRQSSPL